MIVYQEMKHWLALTMFAPVAVLAIFALFVAVAPASWWFEYRAVYPAKEAFTIGEPLEMISERWTKRKTDIEFLDTLFCSLDGDDVGFRYISEQPASMSQARVSDGFATRPWQYRGELPDTPATCFIRSKQYVPHWFRIRSYAPEITTPEFRVEWESS